MDENKRKRIVAALTVNAMLLIGLIVIILMYQMIYIQVLRYQKDNLITQISDYRQMIEDENDNLEYYKGEQYLIDRAYEFGFRFPD